MRNRVLLIKLTSMGDLIHALPALTDAAQAIPGIQFDWVIDEAFADVASWHPSVNTIIKSAHRRWKKDVSRYFFNGDFLRFYRNLNTQNYDVILDAQNNIKSAFITWLKRGRSHGLDKHSVREKPAHWAYYFQHQTDKSLHSITRQRLLFAHALGYNKPDSPPNFGIDTAKIALPDLNLPDNYLVFVHNASWTTKLWPLQYWRQLIQIAQDDGYHVLLPCGNEQEQQRATQLSHGFSHAIALPKLSLTQVAGIMKNAVGAVCCDTGLAHIASMLDTPSVSFYGPTDEKLIGATGRNQYHCTTNPESYSCAPCYKKVCDFRTPNTEMSACMEAFTPQHVWAELQKLINTQ